MITISHHWQHIAQYPCPNNILIVHGPHPSRDEIIAQSAHSPTGILPWLLTNNIPMLYTAIHDANGDIMAHAWIAHPHHHAPADAHPYHDDHLIGLFGVYVQPPYRGQGLARICAQRLAHYLACALPNIPYRVACAHRIMHWFYPIWGSHATSRFDMDRWDSPRLTQYHAAPIHLKRPQQQFWRRVNKHAPADIYTRNNLDPNDHISHFCRYTHPQKYLWIQHAPHILLHRGSQGTAIMIPTTTYDAGAPYNISPKSCRLGVIIPLHGNVEDSAQYLINYIIPHIPNTPHLLFLEPSLHETLAPTCPLPTQPHPYL